MAAKQVFSGASLEWQGEGVYPNRRVFGSPNLAMTPRSNRETAGVRSWRTLRSTGVEIFLLAFISKAQLAS
jgi:hypothetical protein